MTKDLIEFTSACIEALYSTDTGEEDQPEANAPLNKETKLDLEADCRSWWRQYGCFVMTDACICHRDSGVSKASQAGHDFWMTRNGHGCGFWDGDWSDNYSDRFTLGSNKYGHVDVELGDDGEIHLF
jgi:hypothetical protein